MLTTIFAEVMDELKQTVKVLWLGRLLPRLLTTPNGSQWLPTAPYDYKHTLLLFSSSMTPTDFHLLPPRELTSQPYSQGLLSAMWKKRNAGVYKTVVLTVFYLDLC